jgi:hypothetical protein
VSLKKFQVSNQFDFFPRIFFEIIFPLLVHPATWFKVEFADGKIVTFRPSALQPLDDSGQPLASYTVKPSISKAHKEKVHGAPKSSPAVRTEQERQAASSLSRGSEKKTLLNNTDPDTWVGKRVVLMGGRNSGMEGIVKSSGNGWVQIDTSIGEVAKRAYELEVVLDGSDYENGNSNVNYNNNSTRGNGRTPARKRNRANSDLSDFSDYNGSGKNATKKNSRFQFRRFYDYDVEDEEEDEEEENDADAEKEYDRIRYQRQFYQRTQRAKFSDYETERLQHLQELRNRLPLVSDAEIERKRIATLNYVKNLQAKLSPSGCHRPINFSDWKYKINSALASWESSFLQNSCAVCHLEKWPQSHICWNKFCPISPFFYKLAEENQQPIGSPVSPVRRSVPVHHPLPSDLAREVLFSSATEGDETDTSIDDYSAELLSLRGKEEEDYSEMEEFKVPTAPTAQYGRDRAESLATDMEDTSPLYIPGKGLPAAKTNQIPAFSLPPRIQT